ARAGTLDRQSPLPLWAQLLAGLRDRLDQGEFAGGFPSELALAGEYEVSRNTVREAVRRLRAEGVVVAGRGQRPKAAFAAEIEQPLGALYSLYRSIEAAGLSQESIVRRQEIILWPEAADELGIEPQAELLHLERVRVAAGQPLAVDNVYFPADIAAPLMEVDFTHSGFYDELASRTGLRLTGGQEHIRAVVPTPAQRRLLGVGSGIAALSIERLGVARGRAVEWRSTLVRGDRFGLIATFSAGIGYHIDLAHPPIRAL
ncbi:MAG: GntR family transcriptional regulator, partial [Acidimicrobiales bacterium]